MTRTILNIIRFTVFFIAFYIIVMLLIAASTVFTFGVEKFFFKTLHISSFNGQRAQELEEWLATDTPRPAGVILGSSSICLNVNPYVLSDNTGIDFFMAGNDGQPISNSLNMLQYCLRSGKRLDYVLLGIDHLVWDFKDEGAALEWMITNSNPYRRHLLEMAVDAHSSEVAMIYSYLLVKKLLPLSKNYYKAPPAYTHYRGKGYICSSKEREKLQFSAIVEDRTFSANNYNAANEIINTCKANNITLILLKPKLINYNGRNDTLDNKGVPVIDASEAPVDTTLYFDNYHMYCEGGTVYSQWIAEEINQVIQRTQP